MESIAIIVNVIIVVVVVLVVVVVAVNILMTSLHNRHGFHQRSVMRVP